MDLDLKEESGNLGDQVIESKSDTAESEPKLSTKEPEKNRSKFSQYLRDHKAGVIVTIVLLLTIAGFGIGFYYLRHTGKTLTDIKNNVTNQQSTNTQPAAKTYNIIDGLAVDASVANRHPLAVIVENQVDARPQSGLDKASLVYEAFAEGGITRFLALYSSRDADKVGPVRSIRTYFVDWAHGYNAYTAHVGGNIDALDKIQAERTPDLDQFGHPTPYWREYSAGLATEHTMYTSTTKLFQEAAKLNYSSANSFTVYKFKDDPSQDDLAKTAPATQKISVDLLSASYDVYYQYDRATNSYKRFLAGKPATDKISKNQLNPKNLIVMTVPRTAIKTRINEAGYNMATIGSGKAKIFIDGQVIDGTWKKTSAASREVFYDTNGQEATFNRGQFWITVIPPESTGVKVE